MIQRTVFWLLSLLCMVTCASSVAEAQSCSATINNLSFGPINLTTGIPADTTTTIDITCTGTPGATVRACPNIGAGTGGTLGGGSPRLMTGAPAGQLAFDIYQDAGHSVVWGSVLGGTGSATPPQIDVVLDGTSGSGSSTQTIYGRVSGGQQSVAPAAFTSTFSGADVTIASQYESGQSCAVIGASNATSTSFSTTASYPSICTISTSALNFGTISSSLVASDAQTSLTTQCSATTPFDVRMDGGLTAASNPNFREMQNGAERLTYGIYQDSQRSLVWGHIPNVNTLASTGTGSPATMNVYGRIHAQERRPAGTYTDMIVVTIDY